MQFQSVMSDWSYDEASQRGVENEEIANDTPSSDDDSSAGSEASNEVEDWLVGARKENPDLPETGAVFKISCFSHT